MKLWHLVLLSTVALAAAACENKQQQPTAHQDTAPPPVTEQKQPVTLDPYATDPYASDTAAQPRDTGAGGSVQKAPAKGSKSNTLIAAKGGKTHVVQKGETLSSIARKCYGDSNRWKEIWEANKSAVPNKDQLKVGTKLVIP